ncbi:MAG: TIGR03915 family putative DNA repair protein [Treponema sp.]|jgi:probable DNA metabolism protein|nr:TIGR03915 family putative DNA repair protein [Treponema sp.]
MVNSCGIAPAQGDLFSESPSAPAAGKIALQDFDTAFRLRELSADAYDVYINAVLSELPIENELIRFAKKVIQSGRDGAEKACTDRGDPDVEIVQKAAYKVVREIDRLMGLLRFNPNSKGQYIARCSPDTFVLPGLAEHFRQRFGETPWAIIDEKRSIALVSQDGAAPQLVSTSPLPPPPSPLIPPSSEPKVRFHPSSPDPWEGLWRQYHEVINNEGRYNPGLQRQFMPQRYWKYLPEMR